MIGYSIQFSSTWWSSSAENNTINKWIERMTYSGDIYVNIESFIKHVNEFVFEYIARFYLENIEEYIEGIIKQDYKKYAINEDILNNINIDDYYLLFHKENSDDNWVIICHNIIST